MTGADLARAWTFEPSVFGGCAALLLGRAAADRFRPDRSWIPFGGGTLLLWFALASPLDALADEYSFTAHMVQHMVLMLCVPPLWIAGAPAAWLRRILSKSAVSRIERTLSAPRIALLLPTTVVTAWHVPQLYDAAVASEGLHIIEHLCLLGAFTIYWWPVLAPLVERRLAPGPAILHLAGGAVATSAVGILITFAGPELFRAYLAPDDSLHMLTALRAAGLDRADDLTLSGLLMWMAGTPAFLLAALGAVARWCREADRDADATEEPT